MGIRAKATLNSARVISRKETHIGHLCKELGVTRQTLYRHVSPSGELRPDGAKLTGKTKPRVAAP